MDVRLTVRPVRGCHRRPVQGSERHRGCSSTASYVGNAGRWHHETARTTGALEGVNLGRNVQWDEGVETKKDVLQPDQGRRASLVSWSLPVYDAVEGVEPPNGFEPLTCCLRITGGEVTGGR